MNETNKNTARSRTHAPRTRIEELLAVRGAPEGREPRPAPAAGIAGRRARPLLQQERTGARARRSHDRSAEDHGAQLHERERTGARHRRILDKEYFVACPSRNAPTLLDSAEFLNKKMREIRDTGKVVGRDRIAVMAALNMAQRIAAPEDQAIARPSSRAASRDRVRSMRERVEGALERRVSSSICREVVLPLHELTSHSYSAVGVECLLAPPAVFDSGSGYLSTLM